MSTPNIPIQTCPQHYLSHEHTYTLPVLLVTCPLPLPLPRLEMKFESGLLMRHHENQIGRASVNTLNGDFCVVSVCETRVKSFTVLKSKFAAVFFQRILTKLQITIAVCYPAYFWYLFHGVKMKPEQRDSGSSRGRFPTFWQASYFSNFLEEGELFF